MKPGDKIPVLSVGGSIADDYGHVVRVEWKEPAEGDWRLYQLLAVDGKQFMLKLQGVSDPYPDGALYDGGPIWVPMPEIKCMEVVA